MCQEETKRWLKMPKDSDPKIPRCPVYEELAKIKTKKAEKSGYAKNPKPKQKSKADIQHETVVKILTEIRNDIKLMNEKFLEEVKDILCDGINKTPVCIQNNYTNYSQTNTIQNNLLSIQNQNLGSGLPPHDIQYITKK
jgi:hypothetical protein